MDTTTIGRAAAALVTSALVLGACGGAGPSGNVVAGPARGEAVTVTTDDMAFEPDVVELPAGREVTVEVRNNDETVHDLTIDDLELSTGPIEPGQVATATFTVPDDPTEFVCSLHDGMTGTVEPV